MDLVQIVPFFISAFMTKGHKIHSVEGINAKQVNGYE